MTLIHLGTIDPNPDAPGGISVRYSYDTSDGDLHTEAWRPNGDFYESSLIDFNPVDAPRLALIVNAYLAILDDPDNAESIALACRSTLEGDKRGFITATLDMLDDDQIDGLLVALAVIV